MRENGHVDLVGLYGEGAEIGMMQDPAEALGFLSFVAGIQGKHVLEIGSAKGGMFYCLCQLFGGVRVSVDLCGDLNSTTPLGMAGGPFGGERITKQYRESFKKWGPRGKIQLVDGDSHKSTTKNRVLKILRGKQVDLLFIDGDHSADGCYADYEDYKGMVRKGGWIAFHDIVDSSQHRGQDCWVHEAWARVHKKHQEVRTWVHAGTWAGIGAVRVA